jgi:hypothetical protein
VECSKYFGSLITNDVRPTWEIKLRIAIAKTEFNQKKKTVSPANFIYVKKRNKKKNTKKPRIFVVLKLGK